MKSLARWIRDAAVPVRLVLRVFDFSFTDVISLFAYSLRCARLSWPAEQAR